MSCVDNEYNRLKKLYIENPYDEKVFQAIRSHERRLGIRSPLLKNLDKPKKAKYILNGDYWIVLDALSDTYYACSHCHNAKNIPPGMIRLHHTDFDRIFELYPITHRDNCYIKELTYLDNLKKANNVAEKLKSTTNEHRKSLLDSCQAEIIHELIFYSTHYYFTDTIYTDVLKSFVNKTLRSYRRIASYRCQEFLDTHFRVRELNNPEFLFTYPHGLLSFFDRRGTKQNISVHKYPEEGKLIIRLTVTGPKHYIIGVHYIAYITQLTGVPSEYKSKVSPIYPEQI